MGNRAIVVLGCRVAWTERGQLEGALGRRVRAAAEAFEREKCAVLIASGGRVWDEVVEADAMGDAIVRLGIPKERVLRERCSHTTRGNAQFTSALLLRIGIDEIVLVTCDWHTPRASALFRRFGIRIERVPAPSPPARLLTRAWRWGRERLATRVDEAATRCQKR
jgi:uncharacterized SAM-binding protein YcdF (DUF218 family)